MKTFVTLTSALLIALGAMTVTEAKEAVAYRLTDWHEEHFEDAEKAGVYLQAIQSLRCEVRQMDDNGHPDLVYRAPEWQVVEIETDELAHQWCEWLERAGFEVIHGHDQEEGHAHEGHAHGDANVEEVTYRLSQWKTIHLEDQREAKALIALAKGLGCEVQLDQHGDHGDVQVRCATWKTIEVPTHRIAESWESWLTEAGFEVKHDHHDH